MEPACFNLAYIDPATGAMVLQVVAASVLAAGMFFRKALALPFTFLFRKRSPGASTPSQPGGDLR